MRRALLALGSLCAVAAAAAAQQAPPRMTPVFTVPTIVGGMLAAGAPDGYGGIAMGPGSGPA